MHYVLFSFCFPTHAFDFFSFHFLFVCFIILLPFCPCLSHLLYCRSVFQNFCFVIPSFLLATLFSIHLFFFFNHIHNHNHIPFAYSLFLSSVMLSFTIFLVLFGQFHPFNNSFFTSVILIFYFTVKTPSILLFYFLMIFLPFRLILFDSYTVLLAFCFIVLSFACISILQSFCKCGFLYTCSIIISLCFAQLFMCRFAVSLFYPYVFVLQYFFCILLL